MASRTTISLVDDLDGSEAAETVMFALGGQSYELDLTTEHATILRGIFGPYIGAARRVPLLPCVRPVPGGAVAVKARSRLPQSAHGPPRTKFRSPPVAAYPKT